MPLHGKLALKDRPIRVVNPPAGFELEGSGGPSGDLALLVFVGDAAELRKHLEEIARSAAADRVTWVAYPKAGQLGTDLNRDKLAALVMERGVRPVTQIAIDATWSALRFRPS